MLFLMICLALLPPPAVFADIGDNFQNRFESVAIDSEATAPKTPEKDASKDSAAKADQPAAGPQMGPDDVVIRADRMDQNNADDTITATGNVIIINQGTTMTSEKAVYSRANRFIVATGSVVIEKEGSVTYGDIATLDIDNNRMEMDNSAIAMTQNNASITTKKFIRESETKILLHENEFTTCDIPEPSWKFKAQKMQVNPTGYAIGRNVIFYVKDVPVFYIPWIAFPMGREKRSGVLPPRYGYSKLRGFQLDIPIYWDIAPNKDLTFDIDFMSNRGTGLAANYRYIRKKNSLGTFGGYINYDTQRNRWRGQLVQNHYERFSDTMNLRSSINITSDRDFLREYALKIGDYNRQSSTSSVNLLKTTENYAFTASARYSQNYYVSSNTTTLQYLPELGMAAVRQRVFNTPLYFDMDSTATSFYREKGVQGQRGVAFPRLTMATGIPGYLHFSAYAGAWFRGYNSTHIPGDSTVKSTDGNIMPEFGAKLNTSMSRVYDLGGENLKKIRHEITPEISYRYAPDRDQSRLPQYDYYDSLIHQNIVYYGVTNQVSGKFVKGDAFDYREITRVRLYQGYSINGTRRDVLSLVDQNKPFTDVILESDTLINPYARFTLDTRYNVYDNKLSSVTPGLEFDNKRGDMAYIGYRMNSNSQLPANSVEYAEVRLSTKRLQPWRFSYWSRYSFDKPGFLISVYSAEYRHKCWSVVLSVYDRPDNQAFTISFNLTGMSTSNSAPIIQ